MRRVSVLGRREYPFQEIDAGCMRVNAPILYGRVDGGDMVELKDVNVRHYGRQNLADID
jgi:hypothetical protein